MSLEWLEWVQKLQAIAQNGLTYSNNPYDVERYEQVQLIASEIMAKYTNTEPSYVLDLFSLEKGYATPKVDVRGAVFRDQKILLVREREDDCWTLPGGWVDIGESPSSAVEREIYEESGYKTQVIKLVAVYDRNHHRHGHPPFVHHVYKLFFQCKLIGGAATASIETEEAEFFGEQEIPELSLTRVVPSQISRLFEHYRNPNLQTDFD
ncbi:NUDIX hydrolase [Nostocales cyanobacterium LEGE 11386]|nr:NUDIX hydrolase [Nostocales cyanobacterium LEGE 11386]